MIALNLFAGDGGPQPDTRLIDLNVVAVDSRGQPVTDLTSDDFQITDAGKPQTIVYFHHNDSRREQPLPLRPNEFSNRIAGTVPHVTLILLDLMNLRFGTQSVAANQLVRDLESMESADGLYLYLLRVDGTASPVRSFDDERATGPGGTPWTRQIKPRLDEAMKAAMRVRPPGIDVAVREQLTFAALDAMGAQLSRFPGRKNIVWITDGVPTSLGPNRSDTGDFVDFTPAIRHLSEAFDRSRIAIYPVRQNMLGSPDAIDGGSGENSLADLDQFANLTGGRADAGKDIGAAVRRAVSDVRTSYQIGYFAPEKNWNGRFHKFRVTTARKGVHIQTKTGYYAWPESPDEMAKAAIQSVLANPFDAGEIGMRGTLSADPKNPRSRRADIRVDAGDVALTQTGGQYSGELRVGVADYAPDGHILGARSFDVNLRYNAGEHDQVLRDGIGFEQQIQGEDPPASIRVVVFDPASQSVGSLTIPIRPSDESRR